MLRAGSCLDNPIVTHNTKAIVGRVGNTLIDPFSNRVAAFVVKWLPPGEVFVVPWSGIKTVTPDKLLIWASSMVVRAEELFTVRQLLKHGAIGPGTLFRTADGQSLGAMSDFYFDERNGAIVGYEVTGEDPSRGNEGPGFLPPPKLMALDMTNRVGQIWFRSYTHPAENRDCVSELGQALQHMNHHKDDMNPYSARTLALALLEQAIGCQVQHTITTPDGYLVAVRNQIVTDSVVGYAQEKHSEVELLGAVGFDLDADWRTPPPGTEQEERG
jgi:uncharacterized protein YrrD